MAYTLYKAVEDLESRLGPYDATNWQMKNIKLAKYDHPLGATPLRDIFEDFRSHDGGKRTPSMQINFYHDEKEAYTAHFGSVFRALFDMSEPTSAYFATDSELDQSVLYGKKPMERGFVDIWEKGRYFRLPTREMADDIRFKLKETEASTFLHPTVVVEREEKPKSGCPFA